MKTIEHQHDFTVIGGGLAGICAAVTAARQGLRVALVQDRPVLGGNASTEIRVPPVGASQCNFAYSRETGLIEELFLNNLRRNPTWCPEGWNLELESLVRSEAGLDLFLNTAVCELAMNGGGDRIDRIKAYCSVDETWHQFSAPCFADCSGDGVVGSLAGAGFRMGVEARSEFDEPMCPDKATGDTMGMSLHMHARDAGRPMPFELPAWVGMELDEDDFGPYRPVSEHFFPDTGGFWWLEWGGALDTVHDSTKIKEEVQRITLAVWDYLKNRSPLAEKLATYEIDWMGAVPGKRESRRFEGDHILTMNEIGAQADFEDAVAYGGWGFDHHPPDGFYDKVNPSTHQYLRGPHNVPLRSLYARDVSNLFLAGRNISATHYALSSTRVMLTCAQLGEAVGMAASHAVRSQCNPRDLVAGGAICALQSDLLRADHHIHALELPIENDIAPEAEVTASSVFSEGDPVESWGTDRLRDERMLQLPVVTDHIDSLALLVDADRDTELRFHFHQGPENGSTYPEERLTGGAVAVPSGESRWIELPVDTDIRRPGWHFLVLEKNQDVAIHVTETPPGRRWYYPRPADPIRPNPFSAWTARSLVIGMTRAVDADGARVTSPDWNGHAEKAASLSAFLHFGYGCRTTPEQPVHHPSVVVNPHSRPTLQPNLWASAATFFDRPEWIELSWQSPRSISEVQILFDSSLHFHFWQSWQGYPVNAIPSLVSDYRIVATHRDGSTSVVAEVTGNHQRNRRHQVDLEDVRRLRVEIVKTNGLSRAQIYSLRAFGPPST
ncbi:FAD-dependent oxidoreductase [Haloferula sp. A504]|uniref:FAD-dependent oxidoreductase n=1 Tax=Haloferula sp. A504 TaxID=3373601 RepID=UPI0031BC78DA|nr:FAD-dependent oxidoreductase [Verrucomicrobiaceae bacterium E54]